MQIVYKMFCDITRGHLKVRRSRNKVVELKLLQINELTNLYFYPDDLETWISISSFKYFQVVIIENQIPSFLPFLEEVSARQFSFKIYWPLQKTKNCDFRMYLNQLCLSLHACSSSSCRDLVSRLPTRLDTKTYTVKWNIFLKL